MSVLHHLHSTLWTPLVQNRGTIPSKTDPSHMVRFALLPLLSVYLHRCAGFFTTFKKHLALHDFICLCILLFWKTIKIEIISHNKINLWDAIT